MAEGPAAGQIIVGRYRLERLLGEGGMGSVWAATHLWMNKPVALKFLKPEIADNPEAVARFMREARAASAVRHTNVVKIHDVLQTEDGVPAMVMDYLVGEALESKLRRERVIPLVEAARLLVPVVSAIGTAHAIGVVHRDLKPDNIFLENCEGQVVPRVLDFGIAKLVGSLAAETQSGGLTRTGAMLGTPYYMAPEQAFGEKDTDHRIDIWSLGVILYECLTGERPVNGDNFGQLLKVIMTGDIVPITTRAPHLPEELRVLVMRMLTPDKTLRPQSMGEVSAVLTRYTDVHADTFGAPVASVRSTPPTAGGTTNGAFAQTPSLVPAPPMRSRAGLVVAGVAGLLLLSVAGAYVVFGRSKGASPAESAAAASAEVVPPVEVEAAAPSASAEAAPSVPASASSSAPAPSNPVPPKSTRTGDRPPTTATKPPVAETAAPPPATTPAPPATKLPGGVVGDTPF